MRKKKLRMVSSLDYLKNRRELVPLEPIQALWLKKRSKTKKQFCVSCHVDKRIYSLIFTDIPQLPNFGGKLNQSSSELLISYLTAPYLRIPLVLNFFATSEHIHALSQTKLQEVLDAIMFEPGAWHPPKEKKAPASITICR